MRHYLRNLSIAVSLSGGLLLGCSSQPSEVASTPSPTSSTGVESTNTTTQADLKTYDEPVMAIATKYPSNMTVDANCSGEGCGYFFKFKPQNNALDQSEVHLFLPAGAKTTAQSEIGLNSLMQSNGWKVTQGATPSSEFSYPWVKKSIPFSDEKGMTGYMLIGETNNQGVRVTLFYPTEMSGTFMPAAKTILDNLQFKPDKLPITTRG